MKALCLALGMVLLMGALALGSSALERQVMQDLERTGLDEDLVSVVAIDAPGGKALLVFVYVNERTVATRMRADLEAVLPAYVGKNAVLVWAYSESGARWDLGNVVFTQGSSVVRPTAENVVPVTEGFPPASLRADRPAAGLVILGDAVDPTQPFDIAYGDLGEATMAVTPVEPPVTVAAREEPSEPEELPETALGGVAEYGEPSTSVAPSGLVAEPAPDDRAACCDPCEVLCGWWRPCGDPCADPCGDPRAILPLFLLLLLGL